MNLTDILADFDNRSATFQAFLQYIESLLPTLIASSGVQAHKIESRLKSRSSLQEKLIRSGKSYSNLSDVTDVCALRVITYFAADVDAIATVLEQEFDVDTENSIDKRIYAAPDRFGYASLHYVVSLTSDRLRLTECRAWTGLKAEIQVRTIIQHAWAEIEHDLGFKAPVSIPSHVRRRFSRLAALLETADAEFAGIKANIADYTQDVAAELRKSEPDIEINGPSIRQLISSDTEILSTDRTISSRSGRSINPADDRRCSGIAAELSFVGITTLTALRRALATYKDKIIEVAVERLSTAPKGESFGSGLTLLYLCYAILADAGDEQRFLKFFETLGFGGTDLLVTARSIIQAFRTKGS